MPRSKKLHTIQEDKYTPVCACPHALSPPLYLLKTHHNQIAKNPQQREKL